MPLLCGFAAQQFDDGTSLRPESIAGLGDNLARKWFRVKRAMGMYVCQPCIDENLLMADDRPGFSTHAACEIHGELQGHWAPTWVVFTWDITRFEPVLAQLAEYKAWAIGVGGRGIDRPDQVARCF